MSNKDSFQTYPKGTILGTKYGLFEVQEDGSRKPVFAADLTVEQRTSQVAETHEAYVEVERWTVDMLRFAFRDEGPGSVMTKQQRAWLDKLFQEANRGVG